MLELADCIGPTVIVLPGCIRPTVIVLPGCIRPTVIVSADSQKTASHKALLLSLSIFEDVGKGQVTHFGTGNGTGLKLLLFDK